MHDAERLSFGSSESVYTRRPSGWNDYATTAPAVNNSIVQTFLKLSPGDILHFATSRFVYTRDKVIREVRLSYPTILQDQQTLGYALAAVVSERSEESWATPAAWRQLRSCPSVGRGGILDVVDPGVWPSDFTLRESLDAEGERVLSWQKEGISDLGIRVITERGRLEP